MKVLAIIPARGGSKGVKDKNVRIVAGKPLIAYAIECAKESKLIDRTIVSTDSAAIAEVARTFECEVMMRPAALAKDDTPMPPVLLYVLEELEKQGASYDLVILLQVTSPIRSGADVDKVIAMFEQTPEIEGVISVVPMEDVHPARMYTLDQNQWMYPFLEQGEASRRQDLPVVYFRNGCIYAIRTKVLKAQKSLMVKNKQAYVMPAKWLANVDDERDLIIADTLVKLWKEGVL